MEIKDRIKEIIEKENIPPRVFAETIGVQQSTLSHILNNRNKPSLEVIMKIHQYYSYVNLEWLLYGRGEMMAATSEDGNATEPGTADNLLFGDELAGASDSLPFDDANADGITSAKDAGKTLQPEIRFIEKPERKITEIRVFFDDNTFEIFKPEKS